MLKTLLKIAIYINRLIVEIFKAVKVIIHQFNYYVIKSLDKNKRNYRIFKKKKSLDYRLRRLI